VSSGYSINGEAKTIMALAATDLSRNPFSLKNSPGRSGKCWNEESGLYKVLILVVNGGQADKIK